MPEASPVILLVEEEPVLAQVTEFRLELLGFDVETASTGDEAFAWLQKRAPDAILLDLGATEMDGFSLIERLSNDPQATTIPIMALSPNASLEDVQRAHTAGAKDYLVVPFDPTLLEEKLWRILQAPSKAVSKT